MMKLNKVKIVFFDIDGTLLEMGKTEITPNMRKALCSLKQNGINPQTDLNLDDSIKFDLMTGR